VSGAIVLKSLALNGQIHVGGSEAEEFGLELPGRGWNAAERIDARDAMAAHAVKPDEHVDAVLDAMGDAGGGQGIDTGRRDVRLR